MADVGVPVGFGTRIYHEVARAERFYCMLFAHALLASPLVRSQFLQSLPAHVEVGDLASIAVYNEPAVLRDYWADLGDFRRYSSSTATNRRKVVEDILTELKVATAVLELQSFFWSNGLGSKICYPGKWSFEAIQATNLTDDDKWKLIGTQQSFNTIPDLLIVWPTCCVLLEAKLRSGEGQNPTTGYKQYEALPKTASFMRLLVPEFKAREVLPALLGAASGELHAISWSMIVDSIAKEPALDSFTRGAFEALGTNLLARTPESTATQD